jgi:hypothetical protein
MRSAPIVHQHPSPIPRRRPKPAASIGLVLCCVVVLGLSACATGDATDARRGESADARKTPNVVAAQATEVARRIRPGTPVATATPRPVPTSVESLVISLSLGPGNVPRDQYAAVPTDAGTIYVTALLHHLHAGDTITAEWVTAAGVQVNASSAPSPGDGDQAWIALPLNVGGLAPGDYAAFVSVDGRQLDSIVFRLLSAGSLAQVLPPLPDNPAVTEGGGPNATGQATGPAIEPINNPDSGDVGAGEGGDPGGDVPGEGAPIEPIETFVPVEPAPADAGIGEIVDPAPAVSADLPTETP